MLLLVSLEQILGISCFTREFEANTQEFHAFTREFEANTGNFMLLFVSLKQILGISCFYSCP
ncbi:hypothetical protein KEH51_08240 [[Brevibacterium] frigoritolerans]|uniref:Uncharacterized protein n=1 Tax=Peribacillus frigoritolerans TaxID=450367 RepID=A0A941FQA6_9BACI|nr:hypothetical protein [Peribacillus frigoritolerans]